MSPAAMMTGSAVIVPWLAACVLKAPVEGNVGIGARMAAGAVAVGPLVGVAPGSGATGVGLGTAVTAAGAAWPQAPSSIVATTMMETQGFIAFLTATPPAWLGRPLVM